MGAIGGRRRSSASRASGGGSGASSQRRQALKRVMRGDGERRKVPEITRQLEAAMLLRGGGDDRGQIGLRLPQLDILHCANPL